MFSNTFLSGGFPPPCPPCPSQVSPPDTLEGFSKRRLLRQSVAASPAGPWNRDRKLRSNLPALGGQDIITPPVPPSTPPLAGYAVSINGSPPQRPVGGRTRQRSVWFPPFIPPGLIPGCGGREAPPVPKGRNFKATKKGGGVNMAAIWKGQNVSNRKLVELWTSITRKVKIVVDGRSAVRCLMT